jgi:pimeloyl-ACP methyl ester carboxylesterase
MGDRVHLARPDLDLDAFVTDVVNLLEFEELWNVTLVGWSYGGMTITGVAERVPERLAQLVYLDAAVPADGQSSDDVIPLTTEPAGTPGFLPVLTDLVHAMTKAPADRDWLLAKLVPQPLPSFSQPVALGDPTAAAVPRAFVHCTEAAMEPFAKIAARVRPEAGWRYRELADNHFAPINSPQATADALLSLL